MRIVRHILPTRHIYSMMAAFILLLTISCGGGGNKEVFDAPDEGPDFGLSATESLESQAENTLSVSVQATPTFIDFGSVSQNKKVSGQIKITNSTNQEITANLTFYGYQSGFSLLNADGLNSNNQTIRIKSGETVERLVQFTGSTLGRLIGSVLVTVANATGHLLIPVGATVSSASSIKIISSQYLCSNKEAPTVDVVDFMRVASQRSAVKSIKICNTSSKPVKINKLTFKSGANSLASKAMLPPTLPEFNWDIDSILEQSYFDYYNPDETEVFEEQETITYNGVIPVPHGAFSAIVTNPNDATNKSTLNQTIPANSYVLADVRFAPTLNAEAPGNSLYEPIAYNATLELNTSLGYLNMTLLGATGGLEPQLRVVYSRADEPPPACASKMYLLDLNSPTSTLDFGLATIYEDWVPEDANLVQLRFCNIGSGSKNLKIWGDAINKGYFTYTGNSSLTHWPLEVPPGGNKTISLSYNPTPTNNTASESTDFGQLQLAHNASNGPYTALTLMGAQQKGTAIVVSQGDSNLKKTYTAEKAKKLQCAKIGATTTKSFAVTNNSTRYSLRSAFSISQLAIKDASGNVIAGKTASHDFDGASTIVTEPKKSQTLDVDFITPSGLPVNSRLTGRLRINNEYLAAPFEGSDLDYDVYFQISLSQTGECTGSVASPVDDAAIIIIDRITMNMFPGLTMPARNPPSFKFHLPVEVFKDKKRVKIMGLPYDPTNQELNDKPYKQIRSYAHQISNVGNCRPLPTNPYRLEFEKGSWDDKGSQCSWQSAEDPNIKIEGTAACIASNGAQAYVVNDAAQASNLGVAVGDTVNVFYHEFANFGSDCSKPDIVGKFSTFFLKQGQGIGEVFDKMIELYGPNGTEDEYASVTKTYQFDSYIQFNAAYQSPAGAPVCNHNAGDRVTDPDEIKACWFAFAASEGFKRVNGFIEECSYFQFEIEEGCDEGDKVSTDPATKARCKDVDFNKVDTWKGYGEYEPDPEFDNVYHLTMRNVKISAFTLVHSLNTLFGHAGRLLYSPMYVTFTTKAIGRKYDTQKDQWYSLLAKQVRSDFTESNVRQKLDDPVSKTYWTESGINSRFTVGENGSFDDRECNLSASNEEHCRGNFEINEGKMLHAGEPVNFEENGRLLMVGLSAFHGRGETAPGFAQEANGIGKPLYFTFHACMKQSERDENGTIIDLPADASCYGDKRVLDTNQAAIDGYLANGILTNEELNSDDPAINRALINYRIFDEDRRRLTNYYNAPNHFKYIPAEDPYTKEPCGAGD